MEVEEMIGILPIELKPLYDYLPLLGKRVVGLKPRFLFTKYVNVIRMSALF